MKRKAELQGDARHEKGRGSGTSAIFETPRPAAPTPCPPACEQCAGRSRGYSLIELLVYVAAFSMALVMCGQLFVTTSRLSLYSVELVDRMDAVRMVQRQFLDVVRGAAAIAEGVGDYRTGEDTLVLQMNAPDGPPRHLVLGMLDGSGSVNVMELVEEDGELRAEKYSTWRLALNRVRFDVDPSGGWVALELFLPARKARDEHTADRRFVAALRCLSGKE